MHWLIRLYPRVWRERYEEEMLAVLEDHKITIATIFDLLIGAIDANLSYSGLAEGANDMANRVRSGIVMIFCAFMLFGVGWSMLQRITDPLNEFQAMAKFHPEFGVLFDSVFIVGCVAFLAFLLGGLPLFFISVKRAIKNKQKDVLAPYWIAASCLLIFVISTTVLVALHPQTYLFIYLIGYLLLSAILLIIGTVAVSLVIGRTNFQLSELKFMFVPEVVILFGMVVSVLLSTILMIMITAHAPQLFDTQDVGSRMFITGNVLMAIGTIFAAMGLRHGVTGKYLSI
jgi:hypothetical protein